MINYYNSKIKLPSDIKLVIFDMDGLMFDTENLICEIMEKASHEFGYNITKDIMAKTIGLNRENTKKIVTGFFDDKFDYDKINELKRKYFREHIDTFGVPKKRGLIELLDFLDNVKIEKAVATSTREESAKYCLQKADIYKYFDAFVYGDMVENGKPHPDIFLKACQMCNKLPEECIVLEDSPSRNSRSI